MMRLTIALVWLAIGGLLAAAEPADSTVSADQQFQNAYDSMAAGDDARDKGNHAEAMKFYRIALDAYLKLSQRYPEVQPAMTKYRLAYCNSQLEALFNKRNSKPQPQQPEARQPESKPQQPEPKPRQEPEKKAAEPANLKSTVTLMLKNGETAKARSVLLEALRAEPDNKSVRLLLGIVQCQAGEFKDASFILKELVEDDPSNANAHMALGTAYFGMGKTVDAEAELKRAVQLNPSLAEAHYNMAQILLSKNPPDTDVANYHYRKALDLGGKRDKQLEQRLQ